MKVSSIPTLKGGQMMTVAYFIGMLIVLYVVYKMLAKIGLIQTPAKRRAENEKRAAVEMLRTDDYFSPSFLNDKSGQFKSLGANAATLYAQELRHAMRGLGTDEEAIYATFGKLYNKCNVAEVAAAYAKQYSRDLQADLLNELTDKEKTTLMNVINQLPLR